MPGGPFGAGRPARTGASGCCWCRPSPTPGESPGTGARAPGRCWIGPSRRGGPGWGTSARTAGRSRPPRGPHVHSGAMSRRAAGLLLCIVAASCAAPADARLARWRPFAAVHGVVDLSSPRADGRLTLAVNGRLGLLRVGRSVSSFAAGYATATGGEPYIALSAGQRVPGAGCAFRRDDVYALEPASVAPGVVRIDTSGRVRRVATLANGAFPNGVAFDSVGAFGHRLLVPAAIGGGNALYALDCRGRLRTVAASMPRVEGGMAVAPRGFGRFGGQLIAADEIL